MTATGGRTPSEIDHIAEEYWDALHDLRPELHVYSGRPGREGDYSDYSPEGHEGVAATQRAALEKIRAARPVDDVDRVTQLELVRELELDQERHAAGFEERDLNVIASPAQDIRDVFDLMPTDTEDDWSHVARRLRNLPAAVEGYVQTLRRGIESGSVPAIRQVREVATQARKQVGSDSFFAGLVAEGERRGLPDSLRSDLLAGAEASQAAYDGLARFLADELAPHAGERDAVGRELYGIASRTFLGAEVDLDETYAWGVEELARMVAEQEAAADEVLAGATVHEAVAHLEADPSRRLHGTDALQAWMQETSDRAVAELGRTHFDIPDEVRRLECMIAPTQEGGIYYTGPSDDFSRAGRMWWSVPEGVTEFDTWRELTTVYHEGVPGHHLQIGIATYTKDQLNAWRRFAGTSGHAEGWALYAERLMQDLGYLDDPADRLGMLDGQRMRAARVVLDIGVHLELQKPDGSGTWTGEDAFTFMAQHVNMNEPFVRFEVNRYLGWPGQAPSYKVGQRIWEQLRDAYLEAGRGDVRAFHAETLALGGLGLDTLRTAVLG